MNMTVKRREVPRNEKNMLNILACGWSFLLSGRSTFFSPGASLLRTGIRATVRRMESIMGYSNIMLTYRI